MALHGHVDAISRSVIEGWAIETERPDDAVSISILVNGAHRGMCLTTHARTDLILPNGVKVHGKRGFHFSFDPPLSPFIEQRVDVVETWSARPLPNGSRSLPPPRPHAAAAAITPIVLTSTGRTGTTLLMSEFARHSAVVVGDHYPYEIKQIAHYAAAFRALAGDADLERSTTPQSMLAPEMQHIIGSNPFNMTGLFALGGGNGALREFYQSTVPSGLATLFRRFILEFYTTLAKAQGKSAAPYFCEKGDIDEAAAQGVRLFFGTVKDIVIVRDPRDLLCSAMAFWKLSPDTAMNMLATTIPRLARIARHAGLDTTVIRYEDLVREPVPTRQALARFLDLDLVAWPEDKAAEVPDSHRTSRDPAASIGRWRNDLTPDQIEACEWAFGAYMRDFDYAPSVSPGRAVRSRGGRREVPKSRLVAAEGGLAVADFVENSIAESEVGLASRQVLELLFGHGGTGETAMGHGWSPPERGFVWSNAPESHLRLPPIRRDGQYWLHITASPFTHGKEFPTQRVVVMIDGRPAGTARVRDICVLAIPLPPSVSRSGQEVALTFRFPDARRPSEVFGSDDDRLLGFSLHRLALFRVEVAGDSGLPADLVAATDGDFRRSETSGETDELVLARIVGLLREVFERADLEYRPSSTLRGIQGYNAVKFVRLVLALEARFGIELHEHEVDSIATMGDIVALLRGKAPDGDRRATQPSDTEQSERDAIELPKARVRFA